MKIRWNKKFVVWTLMLSSLLISGVVFADAMDVFIAELTNYKNEIQRNYKNVALSRSLYDIDRHFSFAAIDHKAVTKGLAEQAQTDSARLQAIKSEFESLKVDLSNHPEKINELAARFFSLMSEARGLQSRSLIIEKDIQLIAESWTSYCKDERIKKAQRYFDPLANFTPDGDLGFVSGPKIPLSVGVKISFNEDGEVTEFRTKVESDMEERLEKEEATTTVVAGVASSYCGPWAPACFAAIFALKTLIDIGRMGEQLAEFAKKEQKQNELRRQIYDIQFDAIVAISTESAPEALKACQRNFPSETEWPTNLITEYRQQMNQATDDLATYVKSDLMSAKEEAYDSLVNQYLPEVSKQYLATVRDYFADQSNLKSQILKFAQKPLVTDIEKWTDAKSVVKKALLQQKVWDDVILADSLFREDDNFSFYNGQPATHSFPNLWHDLGPEALQRVSP